MFTLMICELYYVDSNQFDGVYVVEEYSNEGMYLLPWKRETTIGFGGEFGGYSDGRSNAR